MQQQVIAKEQSSVNSVRRVDVLRGRKEMRSVEKPIDENETESRTTGQLLIDTGKRKLVARCNTGDGLRAHMKKPYVRIVSYLS